MIHSDRALRAVQTSLFVLLLFTGSFSSALAGMNTALHHRLQALATEPNPTIKGHRILTRSVMQPFYESRGWEPAWSDPDQRAALLAMIQGADTHGMEPEDFFRSTLQAQERSARRLGPDEDLLLTEALIRYVYNRVFGKVNPGTIDPDINFDRHLQPGIQPHESIAALLAVPDMDARIAEAAAHGPWYRALRAEMIRLQAVAQDGGWPRVAEGPTLRVDDQSGRVVELRQRLGRQPGFETLLAADPSRFDAALEQQVRRFQREHGIDVDGAVGPATLRTLNVPLATRLDQLRLSLERLRWVNGEVEETGSFLAVNIAGFRVYLVEAGEITWTSRAMVGKPYRQTPVFRGDMAWLEFNPTWTVPPGIHRKDVLPAIKKDPGYLELKNMQVLKSDGTVVDPATVDWSSMGHTAPYIFRQTAGPWNALGQVKFIFPNSHFVFLHDTPHRELFGRSSRAFSSGCIRVENPMDLAERLLAQETDWDRSRIDETLENGETKRVNLSQRLPVYLLYLTAAIDDDGSVMYLEDVYERDQRLLEALDAPLLFDLPPAA